jgi:hypothetical protein
MRKSHLVLIGFIVIIPAAVFAVTIILSWIPMFLSPCVAWGMANQAYLPSSCSMFTSISQTPAEVLLQLFSIQGGIIAAVVVGFVSLLRSNRIALIVSSFVLFGESPFFVFDGFFILVLPAAIFFAVVAVKMEIFRPKPTH